VHPQAAASTARSCGGWSWRRPLGCNRQAQPLGANPIAVIALILAAILAFLATRRPDLRGILHGVAAACVGFALYLAISDPAAAWDLKWVGKLIGRVAGHGVREMLR